MQALILLRQIAEMRVSYAQYKEDISIYNFLHNVEKGFYIDVGCAHPVEESVTKLFYKEWWSGVNIDPRSDMIDLCAQDRPRDVNICIGVSDREGTLDFYADGNSSTVDAADARRRNLQKTGEIRVTTLNKILDEIDTPEIHFLKIDVEKHEKEVLLGLDLNKYRPWVIVIESTLPNTGTPSYAEWEHILLANNYVYLKSDVVNRYYAPAEKHGELTANYLSAPVSCVISPAQQFVAQKLYEGMAK